MANVRKEYNERYPGGTSAIDNKNAQGESDNSNDILNGFGGAEMFNAFFSPKKDNESAKVMDEINEIEDVAMNTKEGTPIFKIFGGGNEQQNSVDEAKPNGLNGAGSATSSSASTNGAKPTIFDNWFGSQQIESAESFFEASESESQPAVNGGANGEANGATTNGSTEAPGGFLNNLFGQSTTTSSVSKVNGGAAATEEETEFYDQMMFEDAVLAEEEEPEVEIPTPIKLEIASKIMPHPEKVSWGGEDSLFVSGRSFGVFDGVSGAEKLDGVPLYSNTLAQQMKSAVGKDGLSVDEIKATMLKAAEYADVAATGASTAVVASVGNDDMLRAVNLGDSVLIIIRDGKITARAKETIHYFDCPFQLSDESPDRPRNGSVLQTQLKKGDLIIAGSDGIFDNLDDAMVCEIVEKNNKGSISKVAQQLVSESRKISKDPNAATPYARMAKRNNYAGYSMGVGGKLDDISCVVVRCK